MRYSVTVLTPLLVGDGQKLSPIDYMVWKDHVNVLDQRRIFKLLAKGPRLDGYLAQLRKADKLDFASWGGFAQNFAGRRIPFEHSTSSAYWDRASGESLHIPTFACAASGPYLPGAAIKGALRTGMLFASLRDGSLRSVAQRFQGERPPRRPAEGPEEQALGGASSNKMRALAVADSQPVATQTMKVYLLRVSTLLQARGPGEYSLAWKQSPRGAVDGRRPEDSTPAFAEMAAPGAAFEGAWREKGVPERRRIFQGVNECAAQMLSLQQQYAKWTGLELLNRQIADLQGRLDALDSGSACLLSLGWGGGLLTKTAWLGKDSEDHLQILRSLPLYSRALSTGLPFPKTRRIVFLENKPATLPGWVLLEVL
ncbi:MAG: type III-A CRISPR-associated RAMP protein Csm5 [Acidobacteria bacterium]|nr:type III-A CRISPR-associated RAMP protein Csm5 [Acidobacteriota bacterium]